MREWFSSAELAGLPGVPTTVQRLNTAARRLQWTARDRAGRGGGREYHLASLPPETQAAIAREQLSESGTQLCATHTVAADEGTKKRAFVALTPEQAEVLATVYEQKPQGEKDEARKRLEIVHTYYAMLGHDVERETVVRVLTQQHGISATTLARYLATIEGHPGHLWLYLLCPRYVGRVAHAGISAEAWEMLKADYLRRERPAAAACIDRVKRAAAKHGWLLPSDRTLQRRLEKLPRAIKVLARQGEKAAALLYPAQRRDKRALSSLELINGDGYTHNVWVAFPDGEIRRAKTWFWQDIYSNAILAWRTDKSEHADVIRLSFGDLVERFGLPDRGIVIDNTTAAANKTTTGGVRNRFRFKVQDDEPLGLFPLLSLAVHWTIPGHGQSKPIERAFGVGGVGEIVDKAPDLAGAWTGGNPMDKPEYDGKARAIPLEQLQAVIAREIDAWNRREGRRSAIAAGRSYWSVFEESYQAKAVRRPTEAQRRLWLLATEPVRTGSKDGTITLDAGRTPGAANRYHAEALCEYAGSKVVARFDPTRLHEGVHVYTLDGRYICFAPCVADAGFNDKALGRELARERAKVLKSQKAQLAAERRMDALDAARYMPGSPELPRGIPAAARGNVVRGEFRDPMERPAPVVPALSAEETERLARLEQELAAPAPAATAPNVRDVADPFARYAFWLRLDERITNGEEITDNDREWFEGYRESAEWKAARRMFEDFGLKAADYAAGA